MDFQTYLHERRTLVDESLDRLVPAADKPPVRLNQAIRHSLMAGGKRLRPILVLAAADAVGGDHRQLLPFAAAMECIHTYSLIHDDLPAMDNDDLRRGRPTCHKAFDEGTAILAGDALLTLAFELAASPVAAVGPEPVLAMVVQLSRAAGIGGMVGGQMLDLLAEGKETSLAELQNIHIHKTGALIRASCLAGACLGGGDKEAQRRLKRYGETIGLAFQIMDDLLDETGDPAVMGKATGADRNRKKATYPLLMGASQARQEAELLVEEALTTLVPFAEKAEPLRHLARFVLTRSH
ncbi:MAG: polyprenyl synthetase family protein [Magnetococcales bacterium]|nr:polyprenyl synthetase family protein [Magnetococcales bacterium]MBF0157232.1 polyprenyl synthetase family protein [Magnetococcales bacterium]